MTAGVWGNVTNYTYMSSVMGAFVAKMFFKNVVFQNKNNGYATCTLETAGFQN